MYARAYCTYFLGGRGLAGRVSELENLDWGCLLSDYRSANGGAGSGTQPDDSFWFLGSSLVLFPSRLSISTSTMIWRER